MDLYNSFKILSIYKKWIRNLVTTITQHSE